MTSHEVRVEGLLRELERLRPLIEVDETDLPNQILRDAIVLSREADLLYPSLSPAQQKRLRAVPEFMRDNSLPFGTKLLR